MEYTIEIFTRVVSYRDEDGEWMDGGNRELETPLLERISADAYDLEQHDGEPTAWAVDYLQSRTDVTEPSLYPIGPDVPEHAWLSGTYQDPYQGDSRVTKTSAYLKGDWSPQQRADVFRKVAQR